MIFYQKMSYFSIETKTYFHDDFSMLAIEFFVNPKNSLNGKTGFFEKSIFNTHILFNSI